MALTFEAPVDFEHEATDTRVPISYRRVTKPRDSRSPWWKYAVLRQAALTFLNLFVLAGAVLFCLATVAIAWFAVLSVAIPLILMFLHSTIISFIRLVGLLRHGDVTAQPVD